MKRNQFTMTRRQVLKAGLYTGATMMLPSPFLRKAYAEPAAIDWNLSDPANQPKFMEMAPNALHPSFKFSASNIQKGKYNIVIDQGVQWTGLVGADGITPVPTTVWGYGRNGRGVDWPGRTFEVQSGKPIEVTWENKLIGSGGGYLPHLLPIDTNLHWAYSLPGYDQYSIDRNGVPLVPHLHGGHTDSSSDGNPEFFFSPGYAVKGPQWVNKKYIYSNDQPAGNLWYHDHALGITRLNVYAGLAGFYFIRDEWDTGMTDNPLGLPAYPYELAYAVQDRMFTDTGEFFFSAFPGDPFYDDFITGEGVELPEDLFPDGGPTALAEFFGDHMVVNGKIWPKAEVEPRNYRMRLLNGTDSRFMVVRFRAVALEADNLDSAGDPLPFYVIGSDQGLASEAVLTDMFVFEPGSRYDVVFNFAGLDGMRIIMENIGGDAPFGGDFGDALGPDDFFPDRQTDRIMAFDVRLPMSDVPDNFDPDAIGNTNIPNPIADEDVNRVRKVALFEGMDEFGRLQPLLGTAEPAGDYLGNPVNWPNTEPNIDAGLVGPMEGSIAWHAPTTENPDVNTTEIWEIYNATGDAHPVHLHLVHFDVLDRQRFKAKVVDQPVVQHNGDTGVGFRLENIRLIGKRLPSPDGYVENAPKDMVTALPGQVTRIKMAFDKPGRYVWHCHILSHEDHEMMRVLHVGPGA